MLKFFRQIRRQLLQKNKGLEYLLYALGEIFLVVIGILIALQINNWNEHRISRTREVKLLKELNFNLHENIERLKKDIEMEYTYFNSAKIIVHHLDHKLPYHDSLAIHFQLSQLSADIVLVESAYEAIKSIGFDIISNDSLRSAIIDLFDANYKTMVRNTRGLEDQFWPSVTLPLWIKHLRNRSMDDDLTGQVPIDYDLLLDDPKFVSMLEKRGKFRKLAAIAKEESLKRSLALINHVEQEMLYLSN